MSGGVRCAGFALAAGLLACQGPHFVLSDLPPEPIALVYRTVQETERVLDAAEEKRSRAQRPEAGTLEIGFERLQQYTGLRTSEDMRRDYMGRLSFFVAPRERLDVADFVRRGARPLQWSEDHQRLLLSAPTAGDILQLFEWVASSGELRQLTRGPNHIDGCYGPGGALAFVRLERTRPTAVARIWVQRPGEEPRAVTAGPEDFQPTWSRDGSRLVYAVGQPEREVLHWVDPESGAGGTLGPGRAPVFTPDGAWIVYSAPTRAGWKLWRMRADGSVKRAFGKSAFEESHPGVSPDGRFVVFEATKGLSSRLFVRPFDGSADRQLAVSGSAMIPVW